MDANENLFKIRPAGRHLLTIGRDLIKDEHAAIVELVKNAYDADSNDVVIHFKVSQNRNKFQIIVTDHGHGMTRNDVINNWLVPSTTDKVIRRKKSNRTMQGRKGIGRWSAAILGNDLYLKTVTPKGEKTEVLVQWSDFEKAKYLEDVPILVETTDTTERHGTVLTIDCSIEKIKLWTGEKDSGVNKLEFELAKLVSPVGTFGRDKKIEDEFTIKTIYENLFDDKSRNISKNIESIPLIDSFDYRIKGEIKKSGLGMSVYSTQKIKNSVDEEIPFEIKGGTKCGTIEFDIRVYDRDADAIDELITRGSGLRRPDGSLFGKREARNLLNEYNGIGVYRNGFRIRPLGDPEYDWLILNKRRVQNPSMKIGSDQVIGYIHIQSEEESGLEEKSARDGLKENEAFQALQKIITEYVLIELEQRRFEYRYRENLSHDKNKIEQNIKYLTDFSDLGNKVKKVLNLKKIDSEASNKILGYITEKEEKQGKILEELQKAIAVYQGQATLGKIINVVLHEGRKPVSYYINTFPLLEKWLKQWLKKPAQSIEDKITTVIHTSVINAKTLAGFYKQLDPLASVQRGRKSKVNIRQAIQKALTTFASQLDREGITYNLSDESKILFDCWPQDIQIILTNLIENSIYWLSKREDDSPKQINIEIKLNGNDFDALDYYDNGLGISKKHIENQVIFEPGFSTKPQGTGLGLSIAGEAADRSNLILKALEFSGGAYFRLEKKEVTND
nr:ATP-binding protein [uncultured Desulfobacter sp.]